MNHATLVQFLLSRIHEDVEWATTLLEVAEEHRNDEVDLSSIMGTLTNLLNDPDVQRLVAERAESNVPPPNDMKRVLSECNVKRQIVASCSNILNGSSLLEGGNALRTLSRLSLPYANHPDYQEEWLL